MTRVVCTVCGRGGAGDSPPYNCVDLGGRGGCGGKKTMVAIRAVPRPKPDPGQVRLRRIVEVMDAR